MVLKLKIFILTLIILSQYLYSQDVSDIGIGGGNGIVLVPTVSVAPISEFRFQVNHEYFTHKKLNSLTSVNLTSGFSTHLELFLKTSTEDWMNSTPLRRIGYGAKFILPISFDVINQPAIWFESINGVLELENSLFKPKLIHTAAVINPVILNFTPSILIGITTTNSSNRLLVGGGISKTISEEIRMGSEITYNYFGINDLRGSVLVNKRIFSNLGIQFASTYLTSAPLSSWSFSFGLFISTSKINFIPKGLESNGNKVIPDLDELIKSLEDEKKENEK